jgi:capsular exopolysaccharide synthesis family protein
MSRIFDALQRSQGDAPDPRAAATPNRSVPPEALTSVMETNVSEVASPEAAAAHATAAAVRAPDDWLSVPPERVLHPEPTPEQRIVTITDHNGAGAEMFRVLGTRLAHMKDKRPLSKLLVSSAVVDEGKSVVAVNLAIALCQRPGERILLIEADLRRPTASLLLSPNPTKGITEWHQGELAIHDALYRVGDHPLWFLSAGAGVEKPLPILESLEFANMVESISAHFDWVVVDSTPMLPMADAASLSRLSDGVLVVVREGHTRRKLLNKALDTIDRKKLIGLVFNEAVSEQDAYNHFGEYGYYGSNDKKSSRNSGDEGQGKAATA